MYNTILPLIKDFSVRVVTVLVTVFLILFGENEFVVDYIYLLTIFNVASVVLNLGGQFYISDGDKYLKKINAIHLSVLLLGWLVWHLELVDLLAFSSVLLGLMLARCNEFRLRRLSKLYKLLWINITIAMPRLLCHFLEIELYWSNLISAVILVFSSNFSNSSDLSNANVSEGGTASNVFNYAWLTSVFYILYQNIPAYIAVMEGISESQRYEQVLMRMIFVFMFVKSSLVVVLMKRESDVMKGLEKFRWVLSLSALLILAVGEDILGVMYYGLGMVVFILAELVFSPVSSRKHRDYRYASFMLDVILLLAISSVFVYMQYPLIIAYMGASVVLLLFRYEWVHDKKNI